MTHCEDIFAKLKGQSFEQSWLRVEEFIKIDSEDGRRGNIGCLLIESSMDEDIVLDHETDMSEPINVRQFVPIRRVSIVDVQRH